MLPVVGIDVGCYQTTHGSGKGSVEAINKDGFKDSSLKDDVPFPYRRIQCAGARLIWPEALFLGGLGLVRVSPWCGNSL